MSMKTVSVALFKQNLSKYLHLVMAGQELVVTSHHRPVARVLPQSPDLVIRPPVKPMSALCSVTGISSTAASLAFEMLMEDRRR